MPVNCLKCLILFVAVLAANLSQASIINMILSDVDVIYQGGDEIIYDAMAQAGGNLDPTEADQLSSTVIEVDGVIQPVLNESSIDMRADLLLSNLPAVLPLGGAGLQNISQAGFGFEWFTSTGNFLKVMIEKVDILLTNNVFFFTAEGTVDSQNMPENMALDENVTLSYVASLPAVQQGGQTTSTASASGALTISGNAVLIPEPTSSLMVIAMAGTCMLAPRFGKK